MNLLKRKRQRLFLLFIMGIGVPSLLLGYLAFRGIQNDQALLEKEKREELRSAAEGVTSRIEESLSQVEQNYIDLISKEQNPETPQILQRLDIFRDQNPLVKEPFYFEGRKRIYLPVAGLLFSPNGSTEPITSSSLPSSLMNIINKGQQAEFQQKDYQTAIFHYQQAFRRAADRRTKGELLNAVARLQKKSLAFLDAIKSYKTLAADFSQERLITGLPLGAAARLELGSLYLSIDDPSSACLTLIELYRSLIQREWPLERAQYEFFIENFKRSIDNIFSQSSPSTALGSLKKEYQQLNTQEEVLKKETDRLLVFQESAGPDLQSKLAQDLGWAQNSTKRFTLEIGDQPFLISLLKYSFEKKNQNLGDWGLLIHDNYLINTFIPKILQDHVSSEKTGWIVKDRKGKIILESEIKPAGSIITQTNFKGNFPDWQLQLHQQDPRLFETFLTSRRGIYFFMFLLIGGILIFGLILTVRTVSQELELARMKSDFVSTISHEFKSPLTSIRQLAEMLQSGRVPSDERRQKYYDVLVEQSERLSLLTENVLNFAKMEEGKKKFKFEMADIGSLLEDIVSTIQDRVRHDGFELELKMDRPLPAIQADADSIAQVFTNLIDNAIKYSGDAKKVIVRAFLENNCLAVSVRDFGIGIKKEDRERVFNRFYRGGDELTRTVKGSGLGLTLVKQIVGAHNGSVHVESEPGQGSTFTVKFPLP